MEHLEQNQVELREDMDVVKGKVDQMLEAMLAMSKNNLQHVVKENIRHALGFTMVTNSMYGLPLTMLLHKWTFLLNLNLCIS